MDGFLLLTAKQKVQAQAEQSRGRIKEVIYVSVHVYASNGSCYYCADSD